MTANETPGEYRAFGPSPTPGNLGRGLAHVAAPAAFSHARSRTNRSVPPALIAARTIAGGASQIPDPSGFVTVQSRGCVTWGTPVAVLCCEGTIGMGGEQRAVSDADVRADLARALALPSRTAKHLGGKADVKHDALLDGADVGPLVEQACAEAGGQQALATQLGVSRAYINAVVNRHRPPNAAILAALGLRKVVAVRYAPVKGSAA